MATLKTPVSPDDHIQGNPDAPVTLLEYGDYECPYCGAAYPIVKELQADYADELRFVFRNFPLTQIHPLAEPAAESAEYAAANKKFWEMHDALYENQQRLSTPTFFELAEALNLDGGGLQRALETQEFTPRIRQDFMSGVRSGVNGTPTFFINGVRHEGGFEYKDLADTLDAALARPKRKVS
jgi:protein-disulfide isomerase